MLISKLGVGDNIKLVGSKTHEEILGLLTESNIFIITSVTANDGDEETGVLVLKEAQAVGLPVISTLHNGIPEGVIDGKTGFLVPERDVSAITERLIYLIENPEMLPAIGRAGRKFIEDNYDIIKLNNRLNKIYQDLLGQDNNSQNPPSYKITN